MPLAVVFSGQGHQHAAMLPWLADHPLLARMNAALGVDDWRTALADPAWAHANRNAQVLITASALAAWSQLREALPEPVAMAGYSVGELAAFSAAGVFDADEAVALAAERAALMDAAAAASPGGLTGVTGLPRDAIERLIRATPLRIAISNGDDSVVLGGPFDALDDVEFEASVQGARCTRLAVAIASHTPSMQPAARAFDAALQSTLSNAPRVPLFSNAEDRVWTAAQARTALARQIATTVHWDDCMDHIAQRGPRCVLEIGGGQALAKLWNQRHPHIPARSADEFRSVQGLVAWVARCVA